MSAVTIQGRVLHCLPTAAEPAPSVSFTEIDGSNVNLTIFDVSGKHIETLQNSNMHAGRYLFRFTPKRRSGNLYVCRLTIDG